MKKRSEDRYSPNQVLLSAALTVVAASILAGQSLWIPASRIPNLHVRAIALAVTDAVASFASETGLDGFMPDARKSFLSWSGLSELPEWDTRYFNRRNAVSRVETAKDSPAAALPENPAESPAEVPVPTAEPDSGGIPSQPVPVPVPDPGSSSPPAIYSSVNPLRLYFFGDSQVFSLANGLSRLLGPSSPVTVDFLAVHSSGFIRGDYFNWPAKLSDTLAANRYDAVVIMLGMNDYQNFWDNQGRIMKKHTPEWEAAYGEKCSELIDLALLSVPRVYWVGMPRVKDPAYEESLRYIDSVQDRIAARFGPGIVVRCPISGALGEAAGETVGGFVSHLTLEKGSAVQVMSSDGNHFTVEGGQYAMQGLLHRLSEDWLFSEIPVAHLPE